MAGMAPPPKVVVPKPAATPHAPRSGNDWEFDEQKEMQRITIKPYQGTTRMRL
jgi:hypothetical protein